MQRVDLGGLTCDEAAALLEQTLGKHRLIGDDDALERIVARCGGLPLAIRMVTAKLTLHRHMSLSDYADQLDGQPETLDEFDLGDVTLQSRLPSSTR